MNMRTPSYDQLLSVQMARVKETRDDPLECRMADCQKFDNAGMSPKSDPDAQKCLTAYMTVNGVKALVLFDSGSTTVSVSPEFVDVVRVQKKPLARPATLQLGCVGNQSKINFGCELSVTFAGLNNVSVYADVVNLEQYDVVVGTPFLHQFRCILDFTSNAIVVNDNCVNGLVGGDAPGRSKKPRKAVRKPNMRVARNMQKTEFNRD
jgi:hypothetical protein